MSQARARGRCSIATASRFTRNSLDLVRSLAYPATNVNALVADVGAKVTSEQLRDQTVRQTQGGNFISLSGQNVPANQPISLRFSDLPLGVSSDAAASDVPKQATSDRALLLIFIGVVGLMAALLVALPSAAPPERACRGGRHRPG